jgi:hypothetical protein
VTQQGSRTKAVVVAIIAALALAAGIGFAVWPKTDDTARATNPVATAPATPSATPSIEPGTVPSNLPDIAFDKSGKPDYCKTQTKPFGGEAAEVFGADNVMAAYCQMVGFTLDASSFVPSMLRGPEDGKFTPIMFSSVKEYMTPKTAAAWDARVKAYLSGGAKDEGAVQTLMFHNIHNERSGLHVLTREEAGGRPVVIGKSFSPGSAGVTTYDGREHLEMTFTVRASIRVQKNGVEGTMPVTKTITYWLLPTGRDTKPWVIDGYDGTYKDDGFHADKTKRN